MIGSRGGPATRFLGVAGALALLGLAGEAAGQERDTIPADVEPNQVSTVDGLSIPADRGDAFFGGGELFLAPRAYLLDRNRDASPDNEGLSIGGGVTWKSGWLFDRLRLAATGSFAPVIYGPEDKDGTGLWKPGPDGIAVLSELNATVRFARETGLRVGRQRFELPYLGSHDIRMIPNTFEAIAVGDVSTTVDGLAWIVGYVNRIKLKNSDDFVPMSEAAGVEDEDRGVLMAGLRYLFPGGLELSVTNQHTFDIFNTFFAKAETELALSGAWSLGLNLQYTDQRDAGDAFLDDFATGMVSGKVELKTGRTTFRVAASSTRDERGMFKPYGNPSNYLSVIVDDFDRAGEDAWLLGITHDFGQVGPGKLSTFANVVHGDTPESGDAASPDETEYDLTVDWRLNRSWSDRIWVRVRGAYVDQDEAAGGDDFFDFRIIINYDYDILPGGRG